MPFMYGICGRRSCVVVSFGSSSRSVSVTCQVKGCCQSNILSPVCVHCTTFHLTLMITSAQVVETSVTSTDNSPSQDYTHPDDQTTLLHVTPGLKPSTVLRSLGRQSERLAKDYITYVSTIRRIRQQLWFNHRCKDHGLVPAGLKLKSPLNTQEAIQIVKATCRRLVKARINDCHRRLKRYNSKRQQLHDKLNQLIPTELLDTITTIADKRANKATGRARTGHQQKLTRLLRNKEQRPSKTDDNWVRNISSRPLDKNETPVLS